MIQISNKSKCCGCGACDNICPRNSISMKRDAEGFLYPEVDSSTCVNCGLCEKVCPILNKSERQDIISAYALQSLDKSIRFESASGGAFTGIANYVLKKNGIVYGVIFDEDMNVVHTKAETVHELGKMRGSKYVQSRVGHIFVDVKKELNADRWVCFSGTPCQVEGLSRFLGRKYEKLILVDLVCHGVPSPKVWEKYIREMETEQGKKIVQYSFRSKKTGYHDFGTEIVFEDATSIYTHDKGIDRDFMHVAFFNEICSRPSCHDCKFKTKARVSDFTIFDLWHLSEFYPTQEDDLGTTAVLVHTEKGVKLIENLDSENFLAPIDINKVIALDGNNIEFSMIPSTERSAFFADLDLLTCRELFLKYLQEKKKSEIAVIIKKMLKKLRIFEFAKKIFYEMKKQTYKKHLK